VSVVYRELRTSRMARGRARRTGVGLRVAAPYHASVTVAPPRADNRLPTLSRRENEVLERVAHGLTNAEIALELHVTVHAVKYHLSAIYRKLGVSNRTQAAAVYYEPFESGERARGRVA
jgi:DNA-binding NarL/FixJ family response regulator